MWRKEASDKKPLSEILFLYSYEHLIYSSWVKERITIWFFLFPFLFFVGCEIEKVDLVFLMDGSNSIHSNDFQKMKAFLASVVQDFDVSTNRVQIGVAQFSHTYKPEFPLGTFIGKKEISFQIENIQQIFGYTSIGAALQQVGHYFQPDMGSRINAGTPQVLLVLTDGRSQDEVAQAAENLRHKGIDIYSVGIGDVDDQQLIQITGSANKKLTVHNFDELKKIKKRIIRNICTSEGESSKYFVLHVYSAHLHWHVPQGLFMSPGGGGRI